MSRTKACLTCRSRKVKCDRLHPRCSTCSRLDRQCTTPTVSADITWLPTRVIGPSLGSPTAVHEHQDYEAGARGPPLLTEHERARYIAQILSSTLHTSVEELLADLETHSRDLEGDKTFNLGSFGVFRHQTAAADCLTVTVQNVKSIADRSWDTPSTGQMLGAFSMEAALNDLDPVPMDDQQAWELSYHEGPMIEMDHDDNNWQLPSHASFQGKDPILSAMLTSADMFSPSPPMPMPITYSPDVSDLDFDSIRLLLDRYQHTLVPYFVPVRIRAKSPWETLHIPKVHETLGEVMVRGDGGNARLALTFAVLGASAFHLDILRPRTNAVAGPLWRVLGDRYRVRAKSRLKSCLRNISSGKKEEDYKDVLVALLSMVTISVVSGEMDEAYAYLRDIERLIALYGVDKIRKSVGVRMLHSTFLYLRTLQASIGIFGHSAPGAMLNGHLRGSGDGESASARASASMLASQNAGLWTELLQAEEHSDSTATRQTGDQPRVCHSCGANKSIFEQIYSVPESLFLLISRATVLTQEVQRLKQEQARSGHVDHDPFSVKVSQLETDICGWKNDIDMPMPGPSQNTARTNTAHCSNCHLTISRPDAESESESGMNLNLDQNQNGQRPPLCEALLYHFREALHAALLIYFYRCVRNVDTLFLQQFAEKTIEHLLRYAEYKRQSLDPSSNLCWPGFIAGCEAMDPKSRRRISAWFTAETAQTGIRMFEVAGQAVQQVWDARELANDRNLPWSQVLKESRTLDKLVLS